MMQERMGAPVCDALRVIGRSIGFSSGK